MVDFHGWEIKGSVFLRDGPESRHGMSVFLTTLGRVDKIT